MSTNQSIQMDDIQGLILRGYNYPNIRYIILKIVDKAGAQKFCADLVPGSNSGGLSITNAEPWPNGEKPAYCLNIGFTYQGMAALIGTDNCNEVAFKSSREVFKSFSRGAVADAVDISDTGASAPANWWRNGGWISKDSGPKSDGSDLHIQITLFTLSTDTREQYYAKLLAMIPQSSAGPAVVPVYFQDSDPVVVDGHSDYVHFGYRDSLSQPRIQNLYWNKPAVRKLLGLSTIDDRPEVPVDRFVIVARAKDYFAHPLLVNGTFAAFRLLYQDVGKFTEFINSDSRTPPELMAAKMCGRWRDGTPLVVSPNGEAKSLGEPGPHNFNFTNFNYLKASPNQPLDQSSDELGLKCPYAAHIRRANPRDDTDVTDNNDKAVTHRIVRRASPYGPVYDPTEKGEVQRGLVGLFIGAVLDFQFRFVTMAWLEQNGFRKPDASGNFSGVDPLFGPQVADADPTHDNVFRYNDKGTYIESPAKLTRFIRTDGSLYVFLPGIQGLINLSKGTLPSAAGVKQ